MVFVHSKTIWNKIGEAHELIINYCEFHIEYFEEFKTDDRVGVHYKIIADADLDYALGVCDAMDLKYEFDYEDNDVYYLDIFLENR